MLNIRKFLQRHADAGTLVNATTQYVNAYTGAGTAFSGVNDLSAGMKTYYNTELLENAKPNFVYTQFGRKQGLPANNGRTVEWRKWNSLPKAIQPIVEGVIPAGEKMGQTVLTSSLSQHGLYVTVSDLLELHHVDNTILGATEELGVSAGGTEDTLTRNELLTGTNVLYCTNVAASTVPTSRAQMVTTDCRLTPDMVHKAKTELTKLNAPKINGYYVAVIHPSVAYDLVKSDGWNEFHKYAATTEIFNGEIGELYGVRFVETTEAPIYSTKPFFSTTYAIKCSAFTGGTTATAGVVTANAITMAATIDDAMVGRKVVFQNVSTLPTITQTDTYTIKGVNTTSKYVYLDSAVPTGTATNFYMVPGDAAAQYVEAQTSGGTTTYVYHDSGKAAVYCTLFFGKDAFGVIDAAGGSLQMIIKNKGEIGGPLEQFSTIGYKFEHSAKILYQDRMIRVESCSDYSSVDEANDTML